MPAHGEPNQVGKNFLEHVLNDSRTSDGLVFNPRNAHMQRTGERFVNMLRELTTRESFRFTTFATSSDEMVIIRQIPFVSLCAHHVVPFMGYVDVGYVPAGMIVGLSKFARLVKWHAAALTVQEDLTRDIANDIINRLDPKGVAVKVEAEHLCMTIRGVQTPGTKTITSCMTGVFADHDRLARTEFLELIR